jgi:hypothetical protein
MAEDVFRKLFRRRQRFIRAADDAVAEAARIFSQAETGQKLRNAAAAKKCERAAALYQKAGLGLLAKEQFAAASRYWCFCRDQERARLNQERWTAVPTYWEDDKTA